MNIDDVKKYAFLKGIDVMDKNKTELIHAIQKHEGYEQCYLLKFNCTNKQCLWFGDCQCKYIHKFEVK